jgi:hypothetical protein
MNELALIGPMCNNTRAYLQSRGVTLLVPIDISICAPWITQNEQHFVAGEIPHELDAQMEGH